MTNGVDILIPAIRQYRHNNQDGIVMGYDEVLTEEIVRTLCNQVKEMKEEISNLKISIQESCYD